MKLLLPVLTVLIAFIAGVIAAEDRYQNESDALVMQANMEKAAVSTFDAFQRSLDLRQLRADRRQLRALHDNLAIMNQLLRQTPGDTYLQARRQEIIREIQRLEERLR